MAAIPPSPIQHIPELDGEQETFLQLDDQDRIELLRASGVEFPPTVQPTLLSQIPDDNAGYRKEMRTSSNVLGLGPSEDVGEVFKAIILVSFELGRSFGLAGLALHPSVHAPLCPHSNLGR